MMRYHLHDEVPVYIAASAGLHVAHHGRHGRGADLEIQLLSLSDIGRFGVEGAGNGSGGRIVGIPKEGNHKRQPRRDTGQTTRMHQHKCHSILVV
jgi:hypothetical protein